MSGLDEKCLVEPCGGCGEADPAKRCFNCHHEFFPNRRASATPADVGEEPVAWISEGQLHAMPPDRDEDSASGRYLPMRRSAGGNFQFPLYSATALERVVRERDEALAMIAIVKAAHGESIKGGNKLREDLTSAEAKLAEARARLETVEAAGRELANCAYNISQRGEMSERERVFLREAQCNWDSAIRNLEPRHD